MVDDSIVGPPAKKRGASRQISKDDGSDSESENSAPSVSGSFQKAPEEVIASRRIVKVRRSAPSVAQGPPVPNPFASIRLVAPKVSGVPPVTLPSVISPAPPVMFLQKVPGVNNQETSLPLEDAGEVDEEQGGKREVNASGESVEVAVVNADRGIAGREEQRTENGDVKLEMPEPLAVNDDDAKQHAEAGPENNVEVRFDSSLPSRASTTEKALEGGNSVDGVPAEENKGDSSNLSDIGGKKDAEDKELRMSEQVDKAKNEQAAALGTSEDSVGKDLPTLSAATSGSFSFGTIPSSFETPTAFASFSSTWPCFGSGTASCASLGSGFALSKAASNGAFASVSTAFGNSNGSSFQLFSNQSSSAPVSVEPPPQPPTSAVQFQGGNTQTGEEQEKMHFAADATLFEFADGAWKERGKGEVRVNVPLDKTGKARLLMRSKGNFRLILNARLFPDMKMASMDSRGVTFACVNSAVEDKAGLATYALKFKDSVAAGSFRLAVEEHKCPSPEILKTPENSPSSNS